MMLPATLLLASLLTLLYCWLSFQVIRLRTRHRVLIGSGNHSPLEWAIRAHANFSEYVPLALILFALAEFHGTPAWLLTAFAAMLLGGRLLHAHGFLHARDDIRLRINGMRLTFLALLGLALWNPGLWLYRTLAT